MKLSGIIKLSMVLAFNLITISSNLYSQNCANLDFSLGNFTNWNAFTGRYFAPTPPTLVPGVIPGRHTIINASTPDPFTLNNLLTLPNGEIVCARLGNGGINPGVPGQAAWTDGVQCQVDRLSYDIAVDASNTLLSYQYAVILQDPNGLALGGAHPPTHTPRFTISVLDQAGNPLNPALCSVYNVNVTPTISGFRRASAASILANGARMSTNDDVYYKAWSTVGVDLRNFIGQTVTLQFETYDCGFCGHFGYAYIKANCEAFEIKNEGCLVNGTVKLSAPKGFSYLWSGGETTQEIILNNAQPGDVVSVQLTSVSGCQTNLQTTIFPKITTAGYNTSAAIVCLNTSVQFTDISASYNSVDNSPIPIVKWEWDFGDTQTSLLQNPSHIYQTPGTYDVVLNVENQNGCTSSITKQVTVLPLPIVSFNVLEKCEGDLVSFNNLSNPPVQQQITNTDWNFGDNTTSTQFTPQHTYVTSGTYSVMLTITTNMGCKNELTIPIKIWPSPTADFSSNSVCLGSPTLFNDLSISNDPLDNIFNWSWNFGDQAPLSNLQNPSHPYQADGTYSVSLVVTTIKGCKGTVAKNTIVYPLPLVSIANSTACLNSPISFQGTQSSGSANINNWQWTFDDVVNNTANTQNSTHLYATAKAYYPTLTATSTNGCITAITKAIIIYPLPQVFFDANKYKGCAPLCVDFINQSFSDSDPIVSWSWVFGDGATSSGNQPSHCYQNTGIYSVELHATTNIGCEAIKSWPNMIEVYPNPVADFEPSPAEASEIDPVINFNNTSIGSTQWLWNFGDKTSGSIEENPTHVYGEAGYYTTILWVENNYGCRDSTFKPIVITPDWTLYVPNAFTPLSTNGINDGFTAQGTNILGFEMWIYDRWGEMLFYSDDMNKKWNGYEQNEKGSMKVAKQDVYVWKIKFVDIKDQKHEKIGHVTLLR